MFITLTNVQKGVSVSLLEPIDNRDGRLRVGLRSITYTIGWYNIEKEETVHWIISQSDRRVTSIPVGLYNFTQLKEILEKDEFITLSVSEVNGLAAINVFDKVRGAYLPDGVLSLLGQSAPRGHNVLLPPGVYTSSKPVDFSANLKTLRIHLDQINTTCNIVDGARSSLLTSVAVENCPFGAVRTIRNENPEFKRLQQGTISELKVTMMNTLNNRVDNHDLPCSVVLEII